MASGDGTPRTYAISTETDNGVVATSRLVEEVANDSAITTSLDYINTEGDALSLYFTAALGGAEITALDTLVAAHSGLPLRELMQIAVDPPLEPIAPGSSKVVANDRPAIEIVTGITGWASSSLIWPFEQFDAAQLRFRVQFIMKESGSGSNVRIAARVKAEGAGEDSSEDWSDTQFNVVPVTYTTVGEVFETVFWFDVSGFNQGAAVALQGGRDGNNELGAGDDDDASVSIQLLTFCVRGR